MFLAGHINGQNKSVQPAKHETNKVNPRLSQYDSNLTQGNYTDSLNS